MSIILIVVILILGYLGLCYLSFWLKQNFSLPEPLSDIRLIFLLPILCMLFAFFIGSVWHMRHVFVFSVTMTWAGFVIVCSFLVGALFGDLINFGVSFSKSNLNIKRFTRYIAPFLAIIVPVSLFHYRLITPCPDATEIAHYLATNNKHPDTGASSSTKYAAEVTVSYVPSEDYIESIPVKEINPNWSKVLVLNKTDQPADMVVEIEKYAKDYDPFYLIGDFNKDGKRDKIIEGVYKDDSGNAGRFILILTEDKKSPWKQRKDFLYSYSSNPGFHWLYENKNGTIGDSSCFACDDVSTLVWDKRKGSYRMVEDVVFDGSGILFPLKSKRR